MTDTQNTTAPASLVPEIRPEVWADLEQRYRKLEDTVRHYNPSANFQQIRAAFEFAAKAHGPQMRKDGSPFISHPLAVAQIVAEELHLDSESIEAALLHDTIEDTAATHEDISHLFSPTVADLVEGVSKLTRVHYTSKEEEQMENLRKMLMAMSKDIRVILIKISDRLHNMRTIVPDPGEAEAEVLRDHGDLCPHCPPAGNAEDEVGVGGSEPEISGPHQLSGDRGGSE